jgi:hypothetical protein
VRVKARRCENPHDTMQQGDLSMTRVFVRYALLALALGVAVSAVAKSKTESITLRQEATLNGTTLPAGTYVVKYEVNGSNADVKFLQGKKEIASAQGQVKPVDKKVSLNQLIVNDPGRVISEIDFGGSDTAIVFGSAGSAAGK